MESQGRAEQSWDRHSDPGKSLECHLEDIHYRFPASKADWQSLEDMTLLHRPQMGYPISVSKSFRIQPLALG